MAAAQDDPLLVSTLLDAGANPLVRSGDRRLPIHSAAYYTDERAVVSTLLRGGAGANLTSAHIAVLNGDRAALATALEGGADPNATDSYGWTPLHFAALVARIVSEPVLVAELVAAGAVPDARDLAGMTPLDNAAMYYGGMAVVEALLANGADPGFMGAPRDDDGHSPLHHAAMTRQMVIMALLEAGDEGWGGRHPIRVSIFDALAYVHWLSEETGERYHLLSDAEWEYVARAGTTTARYWGEGPDLQCENANGYDRTGHQDRGFDHPFVQCEDGYVETAPAGSFLPNPFGLSDVLGNVSEWTMTCWKESYSGAPQDGDADCSRRGAARYAVRGDHWGSPPRALRSAFRVGISGRDVIGFRVARTMN